MARRKRGGADLPFLTDVEEVPRADVSAVMGTHRRYKVLRVVLWVSVFFLFPMALILQLAPAQEAPVDADRIASSQGRTVATDALVEWLGSDPSPLPGGEVVSWDGAVATSVVKEAFRDDRAPMDVTLESNIFTVGVPAKVPAAPEGEDAEAPDVDETDTEAPDEGDGVTDGDGDDVAGEGDGGSESDAGGDDVADPFDETGRWERLYRAEVLVALDPRGGAVVVSLPSLVPIEGSAVDDWAPDSPVWPGLEEGSVSDDVRKVVDRWARAYTSGDPEELRLAAGDPDGTAQYLPIGGVSSVSTSVVGSAWVDDSTAVVRAQLSVLWPGQEPVEDDDPVPPPMELDLLVEAADTGSPVVVAWGPPGSGGSLVRFGNALSGPRLDGATSTTSTTSVPTPEEGDGADAEAEPEAPRGEPQGEGKQPKKQEKKGGGGD